MVLGMACLLGSAFLAGRATESASPRPDTATVERSPSAAQHGPWAGGLALTGLLLAGLGWRRTRRPEHDDPTDRHDTEVPAGPSTQARDAEALAAAQAAQAAQAAREEGHRHLQSITDHVPALITYVDTDERVTFANATFKHWLHVDPAAMVGRPLIDMLGEAMYRQRKPYLERGLAGEQLSFEIPTRTPTGERDLRTTYIPDRRADGSVAGIFVMVTDVTAMRTSERQLQSLARVDALTGLPNRRAFEERADEAMRRARRSKRPIVMMFLDLDRFKAINDQRGHAAGDAVLKAFALRLSACVRETDMVSRLAGDEFVVLLEGVERVEEATIVAQRILDAAAVPLTLPDGGEPLQLGTSIGIAAAAEGETLAAAVLQRADVALYAAKRAGRGGYTMAALPDPMSWPMSTMPAPLDLEPSSTSRLTGAAQG